MIEKIVDSKHNLTILKYSGSVTEQESIDTLESFYDNSPTFYVILDLSHAKLDGFSTHSVERIAKVARKLGSTRQGGKSAIVAPTDLEF